MMLRSELSEKSKGLCTEQAKITEWLFGDNLKENLKDAELGHKISKFSGSKTRSQVYSLVFVH